MSFRQPTHTPYDGSSKLFTIGLKPLDPANWIEVDGHLLPYLAEKRRLYDEIPARVFVEEDGTRAAQQEVLDLLGAYLPERFPDTHRRSDAGVAVVGATSHPAIPSSLIGAPLVAASLLVQEDLILMRRGEDGWRLAAGSLCFPSSWALTEKFGRPLQRIHEPVPGFGPGTRPADLINRMFDGLQGQAVERYNWSIQSGDALYHPLSNVERIDRATSRPTRFRDGDVKAHAFIRVERQTLRKLPASRDVLFTVRIHLDPLAVLARHPERATLAVSFADQLNALDQTQLDYKGLTSDRDRLTAVLNHMAKDA
ncbi:heme-dependent oxidative N-demethylase family protein [Mesorhizobium sp. Cs1299R1N3]|uniref:heme-dependent oxidative N-demethylase family protein n=1 Tax=Mesorhizobium sp. Cs1299R1N3 TaxID=3015173 RepID=UPI00301D55CC